MKLVHNMLCYYFPQPPYRTTHLLALARDNGMCVYCVLVGRPQLSIRPFHALRAGERKFLDSEGRGGIVWFPGVSGGGGERHPVQEYSTSMCRGDNVGVAMSG